MRTRSAKSVEQIVRIPQVRRLEALGEPGVERGEKIFGLSSLALLRPEAGEGGRCAELERSGLLGAGDVERLAIAALGAPGGALGQAEVTLDAADIGFVPALRTCFDVAVKRLQDRFGGIEPAERYE